MPNKQKIVFSFDDGPAPVAALNTILTTLKNNQIIAEFYVLGSEVKKYPVAAKDIVIQGHKVQNHSWSHPNLATAGEEVVRSELENTQQIIHQVTGIKPSKMRPPYGAGGWPKRFDPELERVAKSLSLGIYNWDIDTEDWKVPRGIGASKIDVIKSQLDRNKSKDTLNVLMHVQYETARDLPNFITFLKESGYTFSAP